MWPSSWSGAPDLAIIMLTAINYVFIYGDLLRGGLLSTPTDFNRFRMLVLLVFSVPTTYTGMLKNEAINARRGWL